MKNNTVLAVIEIIIAIAIIIGIWFGVYYYMAYNSEDLRMGSVVARGNELMEEENYYEAIDKYDEALEFDPENTELRKAISHAYIKLGDSLGYSDEAIQAYENSLLYVPDNKNAFWGIYKIYDGREDEDSVIGILTRGHEATGDPDMQTIVDNIQIERARIQAEEEERLKEEAERAAIESAHNDLMQKLYECFEQGNIDKVKELVRQEEFIALTDEIVNKETSYYYGERGEDGKRNGKGAAAYMDGYYYFGDFSDDLREGKGIWIRAVYSESSAMGSSIYEGDWSGDKPNGKGTQTNNYYADRLSQGGMTKQVISGGYKDGLEDGTMTLTGNLKSGGSVRYQYEAHDGVASKSSNEDSKVPGQYIIAKSADGSSNLTSDGSKRGVGGFTE
ncbi:MAG: tetratricopeptide repeat protein [Lachnospiraceae bacterium]|nr:tetratricopeptide repeat protein [Lachnospiraceae bacterium]